jgi:peptidoglycan hydrolase-like protein with peptidoglycan-binding domain
VKIYSRAEWGARYADGSAAAPTPATSVWLHHTAGQAGTPDATFDQDATLVRSIEQTGQARFGAGISYTFVVTRSGRVFAGHSPNRRGAHTRGLNTTARAIVLPGNYETLAPTDAQLAAVAQLLDHGRRQGWWQRAALSGGHRDAPGATTACPGRNLLASVASINARAAALAADGVALVAPDRVSLAAAQQWARAKNADPRFINDILPALWRASQALRSANGGRGIDFAVVAAQSAKETGWGRFGGVLTPAFNNTAGIKTAGGGGDYDPDAHQRFASWDEGARGHLNHLAAYVGLDPVGEPHPRYFTVRRVPWAGSIVTVEQLGQRWAPSGSYGTDIVRMVVELASSPRQPAPAPASVSAAPRQQVAPRQPVAAAQPKAARPTLRVGARGEDVRFLQRKLGIRADGIFGPQTERAVRAFQSRHKLTVDGVVGPRTWGRLGA